jgi:ataxin-10
LLSLGTTSSIYFGEDSTLWVDLRRLWRDLARTQLTFWDGDDDDTSLNHEKDMRVLCGSLAKFTRNLVAGVPQNQAKAL